MDSMARSLHILGHKVQILAFNTVKHYINPSSIAEEIRLDFNPKFVELDASIKPWQALLNLFGKGSYNIKRFDAQEMHVEVSRTLKDSSIDVVVLESLFMLPYISTIRKNSKARIIYRAHNIEHVIWERLAAECKNPLKAWYLSFLAKRLKTFEQFVLGQLDGIMAITEQDKAWFKKSGYNGSLISIPVGIDVAKYESTESGIAKNCLFHLGSMDWMPNAEGVQWFMEEVWPSLESSCPGLELYLAGKGMPNHFYRYASKRVHVTGFVDDSVDFMTSKQIMIVPLLSGSGMRIKIIEGMAAGRTIVSTSIGAEGVKAVNGSEILIADNAKAFVEVITKCYNDIHFCKQIGINSRIRAKESYGLDVVGVEIDHFLKSVIV
jgi:glycosyltransferase involved in cell wall biosynthesis